MTSVTPAHTFGIRLFSAIALLVWSAIQVPQVEASPRWIAIGTGRGVTIFMDSDSVVRHGPFVRAWFRWRLPEPVHLKTLGRSYRSNVMLYSYFCEKRTFYLMQAELYTNDDFSGHLHSDTEKNTPVPENVVPGSIDEAMLKAACTRPKK